MKEELDDLIAEAGPPLGPLLTRADTWCPEAVRTLLWKRNGFMAFDGALHVFPCGAADRDDELLRWNRPETWSALYGDTLRGTLCFAEDIFGVQFCINVDRRVVQFDPETARMTAFADNLEAWAAAIMKDVDYETGRPIARAWAAHNGHVTATQRLLPKTPFFAGGAFDISNLYASDAAIGMRARAEVAMQIRDLPDGTPIQLTTHPGRQ